MRSGVATTGSPLTAASTCVVGRPGVTTSREVRRSTGSRRASTRMVEEKRSTDRVRATSSWCLSAFGIR